MNLLSLILVFLAVVICAAIAFIARELIREAEREKPAGQRPDSESVPANDGRERDRL